MSAVLEDPDVWDIEMPDECLVIIGCSDQKHPDRRPHPARTFYTGELFQASVRWAESWELRWMVLSALHGLLAPDEPVSHYDIRLTRPGARSYLRAKLPADASHLIVLGGQNYVDTTRLSFPDLPVWAPLQELPRRGYGYYREWLGRNTNRGSES